MSLSVHGSLECGWRSVRLVMGADVESPRMGVQGAHGGDGMWCDVVGTSFDHVLPHSGWGISRVLSGTDSWARWYPFDTGWGGGRYDPSRSARQPVAASEVITTVAPSRSDAVSLSHWGHVRGNPLLMMLWWAGNTLPGRKTSQTRLLHWWGSSRGGESHLEPNE